jgi:putative membrane protein insertion efficiency factor
MQTADVPRFSWPQRGVLTLIRGYKLLLSQQFAGSCRFLPSCSDYAAEAVARLGVIRGCVLAVRRLSRCHPLGASGHDPVPVPTSPAASSRQAPTSPAAASRQATQI